ncbi:MAG TPA: porin family protein [Cyclobacteriaceae bacterium]|nr:porin family protein [Cyclobacteriaceae bacterium]
MKKMRILLLTLCVVGSSASVFSQAQFSLGVKGGLNFANLDVSDLSGTYNNRTGYHLGAFGLIKFTKIGIQPEIIFSQQGSEVKDPQLGSFESNFSYVNIPIILKLYTVAGINLQAGPQFGFLTSAKLGDESIKDELKGSDVSLALGLGWDLPFGLTIDGRYNLGLSDVSDDSASEIKNQVWQVSVGYKLFKFGK